MKKQTYELDVVYANAAGVDIGSEQHFCSIGPDQGVRSFSAFTHGLKEICQWFRENGVTHVAMESTGSYWIPLYEMLEKEGFEVALINAAHVKNVPGRKSDVMDCQWLQKLYRLGLLRPSFIPEEQIRELRSYVRLKSGHIKDAARHIQHMQKAMDQMNIKIHNVISETTGTSGLRVIKAIINGERSPEKLLQLCHKTIIKNKRDNFLASLEGNYHEEHIFALKQALDSYEFFHGLVSQCDQRIKEILDKINSNDGNEEIEKQHIKVKTIRRHNPGYDMEAKLCRMAAGTNICVLPGLSGYNSLQFLSEIGVNMSKWPSKKHFTSWLGLSPGSNQSGKTKKRGRTRRYKNKASLILRQASQTIGRSDTALGAFYRRISRRKGATVANVATARKLAEQIYNLLCYGNEYVEMGAVEYERKYNEKKIKYFEKKVKSLGYNLVPAT